MAEQMWVWDGAAATVLHKALRCALKRTQDVVFTTIDQEVEGLRSARDIGGIMALMRRKDAIESLTVPSVETIRTGQRSAAHLATFLERLVVDFINIEEYVSDMQEFLAAVSAFATTCPEPATFAKHWPKKFALPVKDPVESYDGVVRRFVEALVQAVNEETRTLTSDIEALWQASADRASFQRIESLDARLQDLREVTRPSIEAKIANVSNDEETEALVNSYYELVQTQDMSLPHLLHLETAVVAFREHVANGRRFGKKKKKKKKKNTKRYDEGEEDGGDDRAAVPVSDQRDASNASRTDTEAQVPAAKRKRCCARRGSESTSPDAEHLLQRFPLPSPPRPPPRSLPVPPPAPQLTGGHLEQPPPPPPQLDNTSRRWQPSLGPPSWWRSSSAAGSSWPASSWQSSASSSRWRHW